MCNISGTLTLDEQQNKRDKSVIYVVFLIFDETKKAR